MYIAKYLAILVVLLGVRWLLSPGTPVRNYKLSDAKMMALLEALLYRGLDGAVLDLALLDESRTVRFIKYVSREEQSGYECVIPSKGWSEHTLSQFDDMLRARGLSELRSTRALRPGEALVVDLHQNIAKGFSLTKLLFEEVAGANLYQDCFGRLDENVLPGDFPRFAKVTRPGT